MNRREFSKTMAVAATMGWMESKSEIADAAKPRPKLTISKIEVFPIRYPMVMRFKFFEGPSGTTGGAGGRPAIVIKITASDGTVGWGESVPIPRWSGETLEGGLACLKNYLVPVLLDQDVFDLEKVHALMDREIANSFTTSYPITKAGVDLALHDLIGKALGKNVAELWGLKTPEDLLLSWTLNPKSLDEVEGLMEKGRAKGYRNFNVKVAPEKKFDLELCRMVRKAAPDGFLWADANGGYDTASALEMARKLADIGVAVLEGPLHPNQISGYQDLRKLNALPIIMDEGCISPSDVTEFIRMKMMHGIAMKHSRCGGLVSAKAQIELLRQENMIFLGSGLTDPDISLAASLILFGAYGLKRPAALNGPQFLGASVLKQPHVVKEGRIQIPKGPGLGIEVDEAKVRELSAATWKG